VKTFAGIGFIAAIMVNVVIVLVVLLVVVVEDSI